MFNATRSAYQSHELNGDFSFTCLTNLSRSPSKRDSSLPSLCGQSHLFAIIAIGHGLFRFLSERCARFGESAVFDRSSMGEAWNLHTFIHAFCCSLKHVTVTLNFMPVACKDDARQNVRKTHFFSLFKKKQNKI